MLSLQTNRRDAPILASSITKQPMINFTQLYDKHIDSLFMFGNKFTADRELIKDCIQDVFVKLYNKRNELDNVGNIESYLYVSLRNRINDEFRRQTHLCDDEITDQNMRPFVDAYEEYDIERNEEERNRNIAMKQYVSNLSPRQQQIIHLFYIEHRKYDDICRIMGINYQSVRNLMHRSMSRLKDMATKNKE